MTQQFRRQFQALRETVPAPLLHRLMFLFFLRRTGRLHAGRDSLRRQLRELSPGQATDPALAEVAGIFERFDWRLDETATNGALTPRALADTFEQSVDRRRTGTYYTGRDVTAYIARATILPHLLQEAAADCPGALGRDGWAWRRGGVPVRTPDDLVTSNLDAERFTHDLIVRSDGLPLAHALYEALGRLTVLDPTCGCGDFLLAALDLLAPLHAACLERLGKPSRPAAVVEAVLRHLNGVDLMPEAVEVCRLRLWLRLAAASDGPLDLRRLPDLNATIRAGNVLADPEWRHATGFAVVIGNPPYVECAAAPPGPEVRGYRTEPCGNLYALVVERSLGLLAPGGRLGMIVPHSAFCTDRMAPLLSLVTEGATTWISTYDIRPCKLFAGVDQRLAIFLRHASPEPRTYSTRYHRWTEPERETLFSCLRYLDVSDLRYENSVPKAGDAIEAAVWKKIHRRAPLRDGLGGDAVVYYHNAPRYWVRAMTFAPYFWNERDGEKLSAQVKTLPVRDGADAGAVAALLNSSLFCWWWLLLSDCRHLNRREIDRFPAGVRDMARDRKRVLGALCRRLMADYRWHAVRKVCRYRATGKVVYDEFYPGRSRAILDDIDRALAGHYGFTDEETDFLLRHDAGYRLGGE